MQITDLTVEVRDSSLARVGQLLPADLVGLSLALRFNKVGAWKIQLRSDHPLVDALRAPGAGLIVTLPSGVALSGPTISATNNKSGDDPVGAWEIIGGDDSIVLGERLAYPVPSTADLSLQTSAYDVRTGVAETVVKAYVNANIGPSAPTARKISSLAIDSDLGRGSTVTGRARFDTLGSLCESLLATSGLGFDVVQSGSNLVFKVFTPTDHSADIRMDVDNLRLSSSQYSYTKPEATRIIVGGSGEGAARVLLERTSTASTTAETAWARRIEVFKDAANSTATADLQQAADEVLTDKGKTIEALSVKPSDDQTMAYGRDWGLGDKVTVVVGTTQIAQVVTEVAIVVTEEGVKVGATLGDPVVASVGDTETAVLAAQTDQEARITALETNDQTADGAISTTKLADNSVSTAKIADSAVTSAKIADGTIVNADISSSAAIAFSKVSGTVPVAQGGTGATTLSGFLFGNGASAVTAVTGYVYVQTVVFTTTGANTFSKATYPWLRAVRARVVGGGGGGGGTQNPGASGQNSCGSGGGGGGYAEAFITDISGMASSVTATVGAGGTSGGNTTNGGAGGTSSFGSYAVATGGAGGVFRALSASSGFGAAGGAGGTKTTGDFGATGGYGTACVGSIGLAVGGNGGSSVLGGGGSGGAGAASGGVYPGTAGAVYGGGGGGGAANQSNASTAPGGLGGAGIIILDLYA